MKKDLKQPCNECPFRRESLPGWLGADTPEGFMATTLADHQMPCHITVDYEDPDWEDKVQEGAQECAGAAIFFRNMCKRSIYRDRLVLAADRVAVFARPDEFVQHHKRKR